MRSRHVGASTRSCKCPEGIEPSASGVEVRRSCPAELQARRQRFDSSRSPRGPRGAERRTAPGVAFARPGAACPGGSPRGLRCSFDPEPELSKKALRGNGKAPCLTRCIGEAGRLAAGACAGRAEKPYAGAPPTEFPKSRLPIRVSPHEYATPLSAPRHEARPVLAAHGSPTP